MCKVVEVTDGHLGVAGCGTHKCRPTATEHFQKTVRDLPFCNILYTLTFVMICWLLFGTTENTQFFCHNILLHVVTWGVVATKVPNWLGDILKISRIFVKQTRCVAVALYAVRSRAVLFGLPCSWRNGIINFWYFWTAIQFGVATNIFHLRKSWSAATTEWNPTSERQQHFSLDNERITYSA